MKVGEVNNASLKFQKLIS